MTAESIARALGGQKVGKGWLARCPAHPDRRPSLFIRDGNGGKVLVWCHAGCDQHQVIAALKARGTWSVSGRRDQRTNRFPSIATNERAATMRRALLALNVSRNTERGAGTIVARYLASRELAPDPWPPSLRFSPRCREPGSQRALIARRSR
jgi:putative DNA primase/helicase